MTAHAQITDNIRNKFSKISSILNEKSKRLWASTEALSLGRGGISRVYEATGIAKSTIRRGINELNSKSNLTPLRIRKEGGGRKRLEALNAEIETALDKLVAPETRGDPESPLRWTTKSTRKLSATLTEAGFKVSHQKVAQLLRAANYSLQAPRKINEGKSHPDRDAQFKYINQQTVDFQSLKLPVISIDAKKKELIGNFKNEGREYQPSGNPEEVNVYDFLSLAKGRVTPYGIYDLEHNMGWVNVGISKDTSQFAVSSIRNWWEEMGKFLYPNSKKLLIHADGGGSNGSRNRLWKVELQKFATDYGLEITVSHFPPGTSKWNKIEHKLFSQITKNWRGRRLESFSTVVSLIGATTTTTGLKVKAKLDKKSYKSGIKISDKEMLDLKIRRHEFHGKDWNYTIQS